MHGSCPSRVRLIRSLAAYAARARQSRHHNARRDDGAGVAEDPVCGSMNASVGQWLTATGAAPPAYRVSQGARVGRAGTVEITADLDGTVWVGRATTACIHGTITL